MFLKLKSNDKTMMNIKKTLRYLLSVFTFLYILLIPLFGQAEGILRYSIYGSMFAIVAFSFVFYILFDRNRLSFISVFPFVFVLFSFVSTAFYSKDFRNWLSLFLLVISFFALLHSFKYIGNKFSALFIISAALFLFSIIYIIYYRKDILNFDSFGHEEFRLGTIFDNQNSIGFVMIVGIASSLSLFFYYPSKLKYLFSLPVLTCALVGLTTGSRAFVIGVLFFALILPFFRFIKNKWIYLIVVASLIVVILVLINLPFMETLKSRLYRLIGTLFGLDVKADTSTLERVTWADYAVYLGSKNFILGYGVNGFAIFSGVGTYSHSNITEVICDFGIIGLILFYFPLFYCVVKSIKMQNIKRGLIISFGLYYFICGFLTVYYYNKIYYVVLAFLIYLVQFDEKEECVKKAYHEKSEYMRICLCIDKLDNGGAERVISILANQFAEIGHQVFFIETSAKKWDSFYPLDKRISRYYLLDELPKGKGHFKKILTLRKRIKAINPDILISFKYQSNFNVFLANLFLGIPHIVSERNNPYTYNIGLSSKLFKKMVFRFSSGCVFQTQEAMDYYFKKEKQCRKACIIFNPIHLTFVPEKNTVKREKTILYVGRLEEQKNVKLLLDAFDVVYKKHVDYHLKIYGIGSLENNLKSYSLGLVSYPNIHFLGASKTWQMDEHQAQIFVLPSIYEGMPNSLMEAMALQMACISTDCEIGGPKALIKNNVNGLLVKVNDVTEMSNAILDLIENDGKRFAFAINNADLSFKLSEKEIADKWFSFMQDILVERR